MAKRRIPSLIVTDIVGVSPMVAPQIELPEQEPQEDAYLSQSEMTPNARYCSEVLNDLLYKLHRDKLSVNDVNKLRAQLENSITIR